MKTFLKNNWGLIAFALIVSIGSFALLFLAIRPEVGDPVERGIGGIGGGGASATEVEALLLAQGVVPEYVEDVFYVSPDGDNTTGTSWDTALHSLNDAMDLMSAYDVLFVLGGKTYVESDTKDGWVIDVDLIKVYAVGASRAIVTNPSNTQDDGAAITASATDTAVYNVRAIKGEITSTGSAAIRFDGALDFNFFNSLALIANNSTHYGVLFDGGTLASGFNASDPTKGAIYGLSNVGTAVRFEDATQAYLASIGVGLVDRGVVFSGSAVQCSVDAKSLIQGADFGCYHESGAMQSICDARFEDVDVAIHDLSGNATNFPRGTPVHVSLVLTGTGAVVRDIVEIEGVVQINYIYCFVEVPPTNMTGVYLTLENGGVPVDLTKSVGAPALSGVTTGTLVIKELAAASVVGVYDASSQKLVENANRSPSLPFFVVPDYDDTTTIALNYSTTENPIVATVECHVDWESGAGSDGSSVFPVE